MIGFIFNHDIFDDPYNQKAVKSGLNALETLMDALNVHAYYTFGERRNSLFAPDMSDEYVVVQYTCDLSPENKQEIANVIDRVLTVKKAVYKDETPEKVVVFQKLDKSDVFAF